MTRHLGNIICNGDRDGMLIRKAYFTYKDINIDRIFI